MKRLLTMNELSISEMEEILADAERFANGAIGDLKSKQWLPIYSLNQVHVQNQALKWQKENLA